jgi:hypothetical protein
MKFVTQKISGNGRLACPELAKAPENGRLSTKRALPITPAWLALPTRLETKTSKTLSCLR